jgi:hypothetical protein
MELQMLDQIETNLRYEVTDGTADCVLQDGGLRNVLEGSKTCLKLLVDLNEF